MITPGKYLARAVSGELVASSQKGTPGVAVTFRLESGDLIDWTGWLSEKAADRTLESLRTCGWSTDDVRDLTGITDREVEIVVQEEDYQGEARLRVAFVNAPGRGGGAAALTADTAAALAAGLKGRAIQSRQKQGAAKPLPPRAAPVARPAPSQTPVTDAIDESDIPF